MAETTKTHNAWERWQPAWCGLFGVLLAFTTFLSALHWAAPDLPRLLSPPLLLAAWAVAPLLRRDQPGSDARHTKEDAPPILIGYFLVGWALWYLASGAANAHFLLLFALFPAVFMAAPFPLAIGLAVVLHTLVLLRLYLINDQLTVTWMAFTLVTGIGGGLMGAFVHRIIRQSDARRHLIERLEAAQDELARTQREAGILFERQRLAGDLHDTITQYLAGILMHLENAEYTAKHGGDPQAHLAQAQTVAREALLETRRFIWNMHPAALENRVFEDGVRYVVESWSKAAGIRGELTLTGRVCPLPRPVETAVLRIIQEALANVARHARASRVNVTLSYMPDVFLLDINDDGCGFAPQAASSMGQIGLVNMRQRAALLGGQVVIESLPGEGTTVVAEFPLDPGAVDQKEPDNEVNGACDTAADR